LLAAKKNFSGNIFPPVLRNGGNCWSEFYKYVEKRKGNREIIPAIKDQNGTIITDSIGKADILDSCYAFVFYCDHNVPKIQLATSGETCVINTKVIRKRLAKIWRKISTARWSSL
jgi:hypothetical protein